MASTSFGFALAVVVLAVAVVVLAVVVLAVGSVAGDPNPLAVLQLLCNNQKIPSGDPFFGTLGSLLTDLEENPQYSLTQAGSGGSAYGRAYCRGLISWSDWTTCVKYAGDNIWGMCSNAIGAQLVLDNCYLRYEQYNFF